MELDILLVNARHFTSKKDGKVYDTIDFILATKDSYIDTEKFKGYIPQTAWSNKNILNDVKSLETYKGIFETRTKGLTSRLELVKLKCKDGTIIDLA